MTPDAVRDIVSGGHEIGHHGHMHLRSDKVDVFAQREEIERGLKDRTVRAVFTTSALELGIDIGAIDVVACVGLPTSIPASRSTKSSRWTSSPSFQSVAHASAK